MLFYELDSKLEKMVSFLDTWVGVNDNIHYSLKDISIDDNSVQIATIE